VRKTRELVGSLTDVIRAPVVNAEDLGQMVDIGWGFWSKTVGLAAIVIGIFFAVFTHQRQVLAFLSSGNHLQKVVAVIVVLIFVPAFAFLYGTLAKSILRLIHVE